MRSAPRGSHEQIARCHLCQPRPDTAPAIARVYPCSPSLSTRTPDSVMADDRIFPPTARRTALARRAGMVARSPIVVAGAAWAGAAIALWIAVRRAGAVLAVAIGAGASAADASGPAAGAI